MADKDPNKIVVVIVSDTFIAGEHVQEGEERTYDIEVSEDGKEIHADEELQLLRAAGRVVEKGSKGHDQYLAARKRREDAAKKAAAK